MNKTYFKNLKKAVELFPNMFVHGKEVVSAFGSKDIPDDEPEKKINRVQQGDLRQINGVWRTCVDPERNVWSPYKGNPPSNHTPRSLPQTEPLVESSTCMSFAKWQKNGRNVRKGEKSIGRDIDGTPLFKISQTEPKEAIVPPHMREDFDEDDWTKQK